jgi:hypothetical protein
MFETNSQKRVLTRTFLDFVLEKELLEEGLIYSYNGDTFLLNIERKYGIYIIKSEAVPLFPITDNKKPVTVTVMFMKAILDRMEDLQKMMDFYGYFIAKKIEEKNYVILQFEPKYPIKYKKEQLKGFRIFHIAPLDVLHKIFKMGLSPKESSTSFDHPSNRIYIFFTNDVRYIQAFRDSLVKDKSEKREHIILEIDELYSDVYVDESFDFKPPHYFAGFVLKNIVPEQLTLTNL